MIKKRTHCNKKCRNRIIHLSTSKTPTRRRCIGYKGKVTSDIYNIRRCKKRNKKTKKKCIGGGEVVMSLEQIVYNINNSQSEICGYINVNNQFIKTNDGTGIRFDAQGNRISPGSCQLKQNYPVIWHTHPAISKYYPSFEDIIKVLKHSTIISYIYTKYGYWILKCPTKYEYFEDVPYAFVPLVNNLLKNFYEQTNAGNDYNGFAIQFLTTNINSIIQQSFAKDFIIEWYNYY